MVVTCCVLVMGLLAGLGSAFLPPMPAHAAGFGVMLPQGNPHDMGHFWDMFHTRISHMEQAAQQNAAQLEGYLRRWIPQGPPPPIPGSPLFDFPPQHPAEREREPLAGEDEDEAFLPPHPHHDHFNHEFFSDSAEDDSPHVLGGGFGSLHALGLPGGDVNRPWWQGPNVCVTREEVEENTEKPSSGGTESTNQTSPGEAESTEESSPEDPKQPDNSGGKKEKRQMSSMSAATFVVDNGEGTYRYSTCHQGPSKYVCTTVVKENSVKKSHKVTHQCCHGYRRSRQSNFCIKVDLKDVVNTARDMGAVMFAQSVQASGLDMDAMKRRNVTLFAPSDAAMRGYNDQILEQNEVEVYVHEPMMANSEQRSRRAAVSDSAEDNSVTPVMMNSLRDMVLSHIVPGVIDLSELVNEQVLYTENQYNSSVRMNVFARPDQTAPLITANCVPVLSEGPAENGAVLTLERVLQPVTRSLAQLIQDDPQLSIFKTLLHKTAMWEKLQGQQGGQWTVFAPTDEAFKSLPSAMLSRLLDGSSCVENVVQHHITTSTLCSACMRGEVSATSEAGESLSLSRDQQDHVRVQNSTLVQSDLMANNGVLHVTDAVLMPQSARPLSQVLADRGYSSLVRALSAHNMTDELDALRNVTMFAPSEAAMSRLGDDREMTRDTLLYHLATPEVGSCEFENNLVLKSLLGDQRVIVNLYQTMPTFGVGPQKATVQCARVTGVDEAACGAVVHELDHVMSPPARNMIAALEKHGGFKILLELIKGTKQEKTLIHDEFLTLLAPTDDVFESLPAEQLEKLRGDKDLMSHVLSKHIVTEVLCCSGVATPNWPFTHHVTTEYGTRLPLRRGPDGALQVGPLRVNTCDIMASNGVVLAVDAVRTSGGLNGRRASAAGGVTTRGPGHHNPNVEVMLFGLRQPPNPPVFLYNV